MTAEHYLEYLLIQQNQYGKIGYRFEKEEYFYVEFNYSTLTGWVKLAMDNHWTRFEVEQWQKLEHSTIFDILQKNGFVK